MGKVMVDKLGERQQLAGLRERAELRLRPLESPDVAGEGEDVSEANVQVGDLLTLSRIIISMMTTMKVFPGVVGMTEPSRGNRTCVLLVVDSFIFEPRVGL